MKTTGIVLAIFGGLSTLGGILSAIAGRESSLAGLTFVVLGAFLISRANKKKREEEKKKQWEQGETDEK
jgi:uncharacterized membrane protein